MRVLLDVVSTARVSRWLKETSMIHSLTRMVLTSSPSELSFSLTNVSVEAFLCIFRLKQLLLQFAFKSQRSFEWDLASGLHGAFDSPDGPRCFVRGSELARIGQRLLDKLLGRIGIEDLIDQPKRLAFLEIKQLTGGHQFNRL